MINQNAFFLVFSFMFVAGCVGGYILGRYQSNIMDKIRTLEEQRREKTAKPTVTGGAYEPPKIFSNVPEKKLGAGIIESKTPQQLEWEHQEELRKLEHS